MTFFEISLMNFLNLLFYNSHMFLIWTIDDSIETKGWKQSVNFAYGRA